MYMYIPTCSLVVPVRTYMYLIMYHHYMYALPPSKEYRMYRVTRLITPMFGDLYISYQSLSDFEYYVVVPHILHIIDPRPGLEMFF